MAVRPQLTKLAETVLPAPVMRRLRVAKFDRAIRRYPRRVVEHSYAGVRHKVLIASEYGERYDQDYPELQEIAWLKRGRLRPGSRVFDLGASYGVMAMMLADATGPEGQVVALEADPHIAEVLSRNRQLNELDQLVALHAAVARESGSLAFGRHGSVDDGSRRWGDRAVPARSIDDLAREYGPPDVVFVDVEGYELEALRGATGTLAAGPDWFVEVHYPSMLAAYGATSEEVLRLLLDGGYDITVAVDCPYVLLPDGTVVPSVPARPLEETPAEVLAGRFFALASRTPR
jgi:FkbM family methyltransferase